jgi:hypothetical protein
MKPVTSEVASKIVSRLLGVILNDASFSSKALLTILISRMDSFHFRIVGSTFETTFLPHARVWVLWGIWSADLLRMHLNVVVAYIVYGRG